MKMENPGTAIDSGPIDPRGAFKVVIVYEDFTTGIRAKETLDRLAKLTGPGDAIASTMWKFDVLRLPPLRETAANEAADADLIIVSTYEDTDLPVAVKHWLDRWLLLKRVEHGALVALLNRQGEWITGAPPGLTYLRDIAGRARVDFFPLVQRSTEAPVGRSAETSKTMAERVRKTYALLAGSLRQHASSSRGHVPQ